MKLTYLWKDPDSGTGNCPGLIETETGDYIVVGVKLDAATMADVRTISAANDAGLADHEDALLVPRAVLQRLKGA